MKASCMTKALYGNDSLDSNLDIDRGFLWMEMW